MRTADRRGTTNRNARGSATNRRDRKQWLLDNFGDGTYAECEFGCGAMLTLETLSVDRYPLAGVDGGTYARGNIRPSCGPCNARHGGKVRRST